MSKFVLLNGLLYLLVVPSAINVNFNVFVCCHRRNSHGEHLNI